MGATPAPATGDRAMLVAVNDGHGMEVGYLAFPWGMAIDHWTEEVAAREAAQAPTGPKARRPPTGKPHAPATGPDATPPTPLVEPAPSASIAAAKQVSVGGVGTAHVAATPTWLGRAASPRGFCIGTPRPNLPTHGTDGPDLATALGLLLTLADDDVPSQ